MDKSAHYMETFTGKKLFILDPQPEAICVEDIAHSLARTVRYRGHIKTGIWYSVAEHSVHVANVAAGHRGRAHKTKKEVLQALMHDAVEAYTGDVPSPIKASIPEWQRAEREVEQVIMAKYNLSLYKPDWLDAIDKRIVVDERRAVMAPTDNVWRVDNLKPLGIDIQCWDIEEAEYQFLQLFHDLSITKTIERRVHNA